MRRRSRPVSIGGVTVGGGAPVVVQSMTKTDTRDVKATLDQIAELAELGCRIIRLAVPDMEAAQALAEIKKRSPIPIVADIHFDYRLALLALDAGVDGLRLNPGNIGDREKVAKIVGRAKERGVPIRIGINAGSLPRNLTAATLAEKMVEAALREIEFLESLDFDLIKVSLKAFDVPTTVEANRLLAVRTYYPIHLGITEAGPGERGLIRSAVGIGILLYEGIGDTIRVSLTGHPREEVIAGYEILKSLGLESRGPVLISCPTCGRCDVDLFSMVREVEKHLNKIEAPLRVAVMGCEVNGPGEAREADIGIACGKGRGALFVKGKVLRTLPESELLPTLLQEIEKLVGK